MITLIIAAIYIVALSLFALFVWVNKRLDKRRWRVAFRDVAERKHHGEWT